MMKHLCIAALIACALAGCQKPHDNPVVDAKYLAERFVKPAGANAMVGIVFDEHGNTIAVTADGKVVNPCHLPTPEGEAKKTDTANELPLCEGTTNTSIYGISQVTALRHKGSNCITITSTTWVDDVPVTRTRTICK